MLLLLKMVMMRSIMTIMMTGVDAEDDVDNE